MKFQLKTPSTFGAIASGLWTMLTPRAKPSVLFSCAMLTSAIAASYPPSALAVPDAPSSTISQALPTPVPPTYASNPPSSNEQYLVIVNGNSDLLLAEIRQVEPTAFVSFVEGRSVIQAGRFNLFQNAQSRTQELALLGIGAQIKSAAPAAPIAAVNSTVSATPGVIQTSGSTSGDLPPIPIAATPSSVEFGQAAPFPAVAPPPTAASAPPPGTSPVTAQPRRASGYYVVVPARSVELPALADRVVSLGAAPSLVQTHTAPRGPHVAVGPYDDHGIAREWSHYLRDAGLDARVHFE